MNKLISIILLLIAPFTYADCLEPVQIIKQGEAAQCSGFLFSPAQELKVRLLNDQNIALTEQLKLKDQKIAMLIDQNNLNLNLYQVEQKKSVMWQATAESTTEKLIKADDGSLLKDVMLVGLGIVTTLCAGIALGAIHK